MRPGYPCCAADDCKEEATTLVWNMDVKPRALCDDCSGFFIETVLMHKGRVYVMPLQVEGMVN